MPEDRTFFTYLGANKGFYAVLAEAALTRHLKRARHIHVAYAPPWEMAGELFAEMRANGCTLSLDAGWHEEWLSDPRALPMISAIDLFFPNKAEAMHITGETDAERILRCFDNAGMRRVALKLGACGAALLWDGEILFEPPLAVTARDTTGAGDCFDAGFLHAWLHGRGAAPVPASRERVRRAFHGSVRRHRRFPDTRKTAPRIGPSHMKKVTIFGGGGLRTPLVVYGLAQARKELGIEELCLCDPDRERTESIARIGREIVRQAGRRLHDTGGSGRGSSGGRRRIRAEQHPGRRDGGAGARRTDRDRTRAGGTGDHRSRRRGNGTAKSAGHDGICEDCGTRRARGVVHQFQQSGRA